MSENGQPHFKNLAANVSGHFGTLCIKGLIITSIVENNLLLIK